MLRLRVRQLWTVPHLRIPLLLDFFKGEQLGSLLHPVLAGTLQACLFAPGDWAPAAPPLTETPPRAAERCSLLGTRQGLLQKELLSSSTAASLESFLLLLQSALKMAEEAAVPGGSEKQLRSGCEQIS